MQHETVFREANLIYQPVAMSVAQTGAGIRRGVEVIALYILVNQLDQAVMITEIVVPGRRRK